MVNNHENFTRPPEEYTDLYTVIDMTGFDYALWYEQEQTILQPRLEEKGYTVIAWTMGEQDSFGPLSRICAAAKDGKLYWFVYG